MEAFIAGESAAFLDECCSQLVQQWSIFNPGELASTFALLWNARSPTWQGGTDELLTTLIGPHGGFDHCRLERLKMFCGTGGALVRSFRNSVLIECDLSRLDLRKSRFGGAWLESASFEGSDLTGVDFSDASLLDVDFTGAVLSDANFHSIDGGLSLRFAGVEYTKERALGLLASRGAIVPPVDAIYIAMAHPHYEIAKKIARRVCEGGASQYLGLTQRGASAKDPAAAVRFVDTLVSIGYAVFDKSGSARTVELTVAGRTPLRRLAEEDGLDEALVGYFSSGKRT
ncbi:pentapeptide repeat protein [Cellulomonas flavigena DSM 20109]|uniref:Pentapeptide repeat protein n=2 Tax=Cellulomonas flavigena TaxID=1711 RepID=D5UJW6_CELFN|nr:pentapeptide repeat protein [Cellulomonas flavigena DSM 20109]